MGGLNKDFSLADIEAEAVRAAERGYTFEAVPERVASLCEALRVLAAMYDGARLPNACSATEHLRRYGIEA